MYLVHTCNMARYNECTAYIEYAQLNHMHRLAMSCDNDAIRVFSFVQDWSKILKNNGENFISK